MLTQAGRNSLNTIYSRCFATPMSQRKSLRVSIKNIYPSFFRASSRSTRVVCKRLVGPHAHEIVAQDYNLQLGRSTVEPTYNGRRYNERSLSTNKGGATVKIYIGAMAQCLT